MLTEHKDLRYGSKTLSLDVNFESGTASIRMGERRPRWLWHRKNETTEVFMRGDKKLRELVERHGKEITLRFDTANSKIKLWAEANRVKLGFDSVTTDGETGYRITVTKRYFAKE